jgi:hypothetical protein
VFKTTSGFKHIKGIIRCNAQEVTALGRELKGQNSGQALEYTKQVYQSRNNFINYVKRIQLAPSTCTISNYEPLG